MKTNTKFILTLVDAIGLVLILFLIPAETTVQIIIKTAAVLVWFVLCYIFKKKFEAKLSDEDTEENKEE